MYIVPEPQVFKAFFDRGQFAYGDDVPAVRDKDISAAMDEALAIFNAALYPDDKTRDMAFLYLTAHFLASDLDAADSGGKGGMGFAQTSRSADGLSESITFPDWILQDPTLSLLVSTYFGKKYLLMAIQYVTEVVTVVGGATLP